MWLTAAFWLTGCTEREDTYEPFDPAFYKPKVAKVAPRKSGKPDVPNNQWWKPLPSGSREQMSEIARDFSRFLMRTMRTVDFELIFGVDRSTTSEPSSRFEVLCPRGGRLTLSSKPLARLSPARGLKRVSSRGTKRLRLQLDHCSLSTAVRLTGPIELAVDTSDGCRQYRVLGSRVTVNRMLSLWIEELIGTRCEVTCYTAVVRSTSGPVRIEGGSFACLEGGTDYVTDDSTRATSAIGM